MVVQTNFLLFEPIYLPSLFVGHFCTCFSLVIMTNSLCFYPSSVTGGELFEDIVAREYYSEADARLVQFTTGTFTHPHTHTHTQKNQSPVIEGSFARPLL